MKLEAGKYYRNRKGLIMGPLEPSEAYGSNQFKGRDGGGGPWVYWYANGNHLENHMIHEEDLLYEVPSVQMYTFKSLDSLVNEAPETSDMVNEPPHYTKAGIECIEAIEAALTEEEFRGYCKGNALKYTWREGLKGGRQDLQKAQWYLNRLTQ